MTTMNYPANYTAIAADEMVYLDGGATLLQSIVDDIGVIDTWIGAIEYPLLTLQMAAKTAQYLNGEREVTGISSLGTAVNTFGKIFYYAGYALQSISGAFNLG